MTQLLDVANMARWIVRDGAQNILTTMVGYLDHDFRRWQSFERIPRIASHTPFGVIELMPTSDGETYSFKYVNGHPSNPARGFQTVTAFGVLADVDNGYPVFLSEMTLLTALRTAATSALAARALARPDSCVLALSHRCGLAVGVPGARLPRGARDRGAARVRRRPRCGRQAAPQPRAARIPHP
jgi:ornithine cyclodeaminase